ncbi:Di-copper centre-containing protein [Myriangium duriaei CBS 260.36]|uniref:tyrosinase n=1 Tax=Myriangium duriaei CBS 260.36 TaxID=1168546 RepID=A0A9P4IZQ8_9PEZI|nr:Di-copper centre-containing protein [Myriangium duriaei CBS 260.36]
MKFTQFLHGGLLNASLIAAQTYPIKGATGGVDATTGARPFRLNINDLQKSGAAWDLYILAMQSFTQDDASLLTSYFQVAGIHGEPNIPWDGAVGNGGGSGYCTHSSVLFPTWHRPYMALFEQIVWNKTQTIAQQYPAAVRNNYIAAANTLRVPYWDWSMTAEIPAIVNTPTVQVNTPTGQKTIANPLYTYKFGPSTLSQLPQGSLSTTVRRPDNRGNSQPALVNKQFDNIASSLHSQVYNLWSQQKDFLRFANAAITNKFRMRFNSIEGAHNTIHTTVGGNGGQMSDISVAAFDPIFWLHHANVDRIFSIWQAINPDLYVVPYPANMDSYSTAQGTTEDVNYPLYPFHSDTNGSLYTSANVRSTRDFGYTYPEVVDWGMNADAKTLAANVTAVINKMYNPDGSLSKRSRISGRNTQLSTGNAASYNWMINAAADTKKLEDSVFIYFYMTAPPTDANAWATDSNVLTITPILVNPASKSPMMGEDAGVTATQAIVTSPLLKFVSDLDPSVALPALQSKLQWRATWTNGSAISAEAMTSIGAIDIIVTGQTVEQTPAITDFPIYGEPVLHGQAGLGVNGDKVLS